METNTSYVVPEDLTESQAKFVSKMITLCFVLKSIGQKNIILPKGTLSIETRLHLVRYALKKYTLKESKYRDSKNIGIVKAQILKFQL